MDEDVLYDAKGNWWGTSDSNDIKEGIFDWEPRIVDFSNWLKDEIKDQIEGQGNGIRQNNISNNFEWNIYVAQDPVGIEENDMDYPKRNKLYQNYPNPFNPATVIKYAIPQNSKVVLEVYNTLGEKVATLVNEAKSAGFYETSFDGSNLASGIYIYRLTANSLESGEQFVKAGKMLMIK